MMVMNYGTKDGMNRGLSVDGERQPGIEVGVGTPAHAAPLGTVYVDLNATHISGILMVVQRGLQ